jgi:competence protein ComEC
MGIRTLLPDELDEQLSVTGLTHIVAVSGYNLTILASVSRRIFEKRSRFMAVAATTLLLVGFIALIGISPSVLRAVIVSGLSLGAWYYGRQLGPWRLLLYSSAVSAFIQPQYVWSSIGWYLSLAAFFGVLVIAPAVKKKLYGEREPRLIMQILIETTAAQFATAPIIMFIFGEVSIISLLANALVLPLIPIAMLTTFVGGLATSLPTIISWPVIQLSYIILQYITSVISILSELSWALVDLQISAIQMSILYASLAVSYLGLRKQRNPIDLL